VGVRGPGPDFLKSTELLVSAGGFELVALDLGDLRPHLPATAWIRLRQVAQRQGTAVLLAARFPLAGSCCTTSVQLQQKGVNFSWARAVSHPPLFTALASSAFLQRGRRSAEQAAGCSLVFRT